MYIDIQLSKIIIVKYLGLGFVLPATKPSVAF